MVYKHPQHLLFP